MYGLSELAVASSAGKLSKNCLNDIGIPFYNTKFFILDNNLNQVPQGITGTLYAAGLPLPPGYIGNKTATEKQSYCFELS